MRRHGWELPYHPLQVVAVAVFLALAFAFYVFFVPFVGSRLMELVGISIYTPLMVSVFGLYILCAASNPADPAILQSKKYLGSSDSRRTSISLGTSTRVTGEKNETSTEPSSLTQPSSAKSKMEQGDEDANKAWKNSAFTCGILGGTACCDDFSLCGSHLEQARYEEDKLYCSLCEVEILKCSKHCRVCDKCIDCFDHHCRWLNNCIGKKNYRIFIALMISGLCMLILQWAVGVWVIARCFLNRRQFEEDVSSKLGSSFSVVPFLTVVAVCTVLAAFATLPLGQLCLFHALLIQKGISTYDYIMAMRERDQQLGVGESLPSPYASPASSVATAMSGASSTGALHHAAWCTPPRLFVDHEQSAVQLDRVKSIGLEATKKPHVDRNVVKKLPAKISPWALARLNPEDAVRAVAEARKNSSVLRPVVRKAEAAAVIAETDSSAECSSGEVIRDVVVHSPPSMERLNRLSNAVPSNSRATRSWHEEVKVPVVLGGGAHGSKRLVEGGGSPAKVATILTPLQVEARNAFCGSGDIVLQSGSSSTMSSGGSPNARHSCEYGLNNAQEHVSPYNDNDAAASAAAWPSTAWFGRSTSDGYEASGGESADDSDHHRYHLDLQKQHPWNEGTHHVKRQELELIVSYGENDDGPHCLGGSMDVGRTFR